MWIHEVVQTRFAFSDVLNFHRIDDDRFHHVMVSIGKEPADFSVYIDGKLEKQDLAAVGVFFPLQSLGIFFKLVLPPYYQPFFPQ